MKRLILGFVFVMILSSISYAGVTENPDGSRTLTVLITAEEWKALEYLLEDPEVWLEHMVAYKISRAEREVIDGNDLSDKKFEKLSKSERKNLVKNAIIKTRKERDAQN